MVMVDAPAIRQRLFASRAGDGTTLYLAFLTDGSCAILRNDEVVESWDDDAKALGLALDRFMALTQAAQNTPARAGRSPVFRS